MHVLLFPVLCPPLNNLLTYFTVFNLCYPSSHYFVFSRAVALPALGGQYPVFSAAPAAKLMEEGKVHTVEHLINPLAMQHPEHTTASAAAAAAAATVLPAVSTPPPFQVGKKTLTHVFRCYAIMVWWSPWRMICVSDSKQKSLNSLLRFNVLLSYNIFILCESDLPDECPVGWKKRVFFEVTSIKTLVLFFFNLKDEWLLQQQIVFIN